MSLESSGLVCELPGCGTTQKDLEQAFAEYVSEYCVKCEKKRDGSLCRCPFPCSLAFTGMMLVKIFELIQKEIPSGMKSVQVCYKHPELLRQAREFSMESKDKKVSLEAQSGTIESSSGLNIAATKSITVSSSSNITKTQRLFLQSGVACSSSNSLSTPEEYLSEVQTQRAFSSLKAMEMSSENSVVGLTSSILPDKKLIFVQSQVVLPEELFKIPVNDMLEPRETSLSAYENHSEGEETQFVYNSDGHNNIIIQGVGEDGGLSKSARVMKIHLSDMSGFLLNDIVSDSRAMDQSSSNDMSYELSDSIIMRHDGREKCEVDEQRKRGYAGSDNILEPATNSINIQQIKRRKNPKPSKSLRPSTIRKIEEFSEERFENNIENTRINPNIEIQHSNINDGDNKNIRIHCKFSDRMIARELPSLINIPKLCDLVFYCSDGQVFSSGVILASVSGFLKELMFSQPRIDANRTIILPPEFNTSQLHLLNKIIYQELNLEEINLDELYNILPLAQLLNIQSIIQLYEARVYSSQSIIHFDLDPVVNTDQHQDQHQASGRELNNIDNNKHNRSKFGEVHELDNENHQENQHRNIINQHKRKVIFPDGEESLSDSMVLLDEHGHYKFSQENQEENEALNDNIEGQHQINVQPSVSGNDPAGMLDVGMPPEIQPAATDIPGKLDHQQLCRKRDPLSIGIIRVDKNELNPDYLDETGLVRLDTRLEMAIHYCIVCDAKFKKYKQAVTHYGNMHMLVAKLSCDSCDQLFEDMYACNKHKHTVHGGFDLNLQCYLCKSVQYSRHRLKTHIKDAHSNVYGEVQCKTCGMKFPAKYYLSQHFHNNHNQTQGTSCGICRKHFSGKRYLTMHLKSVHQTGSRFDRKCKTCGEPFQNKKQLAFHRVKMHNDPDKSDLEVCNHCSKYFKTKTELKNHIQKKHS